MRKRQMIAAAAMCTFIMALAGCSQQSTSETAAKETAAQTTAQESQAETVKSEEAEAAENEEAEAINVDELGPIMKRAYETGEINVCYFATKPPFQFHKIIDGEDKIVGFEVALSDYVAEKLSEEFGREVKMVPQVMTVQGGLAALQAGQVDCMPDLAGTAERRENMDFSIPYHRSLKTIVVLKERAGEDIFRAENQLKGVTVSAEKGSSDAICLKEQYPDVDLLELEKTADSLISVLTGKVDGALFSEKTAILYCLANPELQIVDELSFDIPKERDPGASFAVPKGNEDFVAFIDKCLEQVMSDGTFARFEDEAISLLEDGDALKEYNAQNYLN